MPKIIWRKLNDNDILQEGDFWKNISMPKGCVNLSEVTIDTSSSNIGKRVGDVLASPNLGELWPNWVIVRVAGIETTESDIRHAEPNERKLEPYL